VRKIDIYNHVMPQRYLDMMKLHSKDANIVKRMSSIRMLWDIEARVEMLMQWPDVQQVLTLALPAPEAIGDAELSPILARIANDDMAAMVAKWPQQFPAFVASLPMNNIPAALEEMDRAIQGLGARGIQLTTNINGRPLDEPEFFAVFERATKRDLAGSWLAVRNQRGNGAHRFLRLVRQAAGHAHHYPPLRGNDSFPFRTGRDTLGAARQPQCG
jgi:predicted TIM-barrel fold metal-dependent hydrolase